VKKFYYLELLRFFSAFSVLIWHYQHFFKPYSSFSDINISESRFVQPFYPILNIFYNYGNFGVTMFWAISGFVFAFAYLENKKKVTGKQFFINRFARLYPLHFATLLIVAAVQMINFNIFKNFQLFQFNDLYHFFLHALFVSGWGFEKGYSFNAPIWSVSIELVIYMFFFFSIFYLNKYKFKFAILIYLILLVIDKFNLIDNFTYSFSLFLDCGKLFYSGILVFYIQKYFNNKILLQIGSLLLIIISLIGNFKLFLFFPSLLLFFVSIEIFIRESLKNTFRILGNLTYAIYLLHIPVQISLILFFGYFDIYNEIFTSKIFFILYVFLILILSYFCFNFFERPLNKKIRDIFS